MIRKKDCSTSTGIQDKNIIWRRGVTDFVRKLFSLLLSFVFLILFTQSARAGQMESHVYTALQMRQYLSPACRTLVDNNLAAYLLGAQGPDIIGVVQVKIIGFNVVGTESHYEKTGDLALNILLTAKTDPEKAFALGWITHYFNDPEVHNVINRYGGWYKEHDKYHKVLEQLETKHVFEAKGSVVTHENTTTDYSSLPSEFPVFILKAYQKTFPEKNYDPNRLVHKENFYQGFWTAAKFCKWAAEDFYNAHKKGDGVHTVIQSKIPEFPRMPSQKEYDILKKPIEVKVLSANDKFIRLRVIVNDTKLYARFLKDWDSAIEKAISKSANPLSRVCAYLDATDDATKDRIGKELQAGKVLPFVDLDCPIPDFKEILSEKGNIEEIYYDCNLIKNPGTEKKEETKSLNNKVKLTALTTLSGEHIGYNPEGFVGNKGGEALIDIPTDCLSATYTVMIKLLSDATYENIDYTIFKGSFGLDKIKLSMELTEEKPQKGESINAKAIIAAGAGQVPKESLWGWKTAGEIELVKKHDDEAEIKVKGKGILTAQLYKFSDLGGKIVVLAEVSRKIEPVMKDAEEMVSLDIEGPSSIEINTPATLSARLKITTKAPYSVRWSVTPDAILRPASGKGEQAVFSSKVPSVYQVRAQLVGVVDKKEKVLAQDSILIAVVKEKQPDKPVTQTPTGQQPPTTQEQPDKPVTQTPVTEEKPPTAQGQPDKPVTQTPTGQQKPPTTQEQPDKPVTQTPIGQQQGEPGKIVERLYLTVSIPDNWEGHYTDSGNLVLERKTALSKKDDIEARVSGKITFGGPSGEGKATMAQIREQAEETSLDNLPGPDGRQEVAPLNIAGYQGFIKQTAELCGRYYGSPYGYVDSSYPRLAVEGTGKAVSASGDSVIKVKYSAGGEGEGKGEPNKLWHDDMPFIRQQTDAAWTEIKAIIGSAKLAKEKSITKYPYTGPKMDGSEVPVAKPAPSNEIEATSVTVTISMAPADRKVPINAKPGFSATVSSKGKPPAGPFVYRWQPNSEVDFSPQESGSASTKATFKKPGTYKIWVEVLAKKGATLSTLGSSEQIVLEVAAPQLALTFTPSQPYIGQQVTASVNVPTGLKEIDFRWEMPDKNLKLLSESKDTRTRTFVMKDLSPAQIKVRGRATVTGESMGETQGTVTARPYEVKVNVKMPTGTSWQQGPQGGLKETSKGVVVFQNIEMGASITPKPEGELRYEWAAGEGTSLNKTFGDVVNAQRGTPGTAQASVIIRNSENMELGRASGSFEVGAQEYKPLTASLTPATVTIVSGESLTITAKPEGGQPPYAYRWLQDGKAVQGDATIARRWNFHKVGTTTVTVEISDKTNAKKQASANITVTSKGLKVAITPPAVTLTKPGKVKGEAKVEGGEAPYSYEWYLGDLKDSQVGPSSEWEINQNSIIKVKVSDKNGNTGEAQCTVTFDAEAARVEAEKRRQEEAARVAAEKKRNEETAKTEAGSREKQALAYVASGNKKGEAGDHSGAIADFNRAIELKPDFANAYNGRGVYRAQSGDYKGAIEDYTKAISLDPKYAKAYYNRGNARSNLSDNRGAIEDYTKAISLDPKYAYAYTNRGIARRNLNDNRGAIEDYTKAISLDPKRGNAYCVRGISKEDMGDLQGALADYKKFLEIKPNDELAKTVLNGLLAKLAKNSSSLPAQSEQASSPGGNTTSSASRPPAPQKPPTQTSAGNVQTSAKPPASAGSGNIVNLAYHKPATQSSVYRGTGVDQGPQFGVDGILICQPRDPYLLVHTNADNPPWWQVDLGEVYTLTDLKLYNRVSGSQEKARSVQVFLSTDGSNWRQVYAHNGSIFNVLKVSLTGQKARHVKLQLAEQTFFHFQECEVYGYKNKNSAPQQANRPVTTPSTQSKPTSSPGGSTTSQCAGVGFGDGRSRENSSSSPLKVQATYQDAARMLNIKATGGKAPYTYTVEYDLGDKRNRHISKVYVSDKPPYDLGLVTGSFLFNTLHVVVTDSTGNRAEVRGCTMR